MTGLMVAAEIDMAFHVTNQVWTIPPSADVTRGERAVLLCLADYCRVDAPTPSAWPAVVTIATRTGMTRRGVQRILRRLEDRGLIVATGRRTRNVVVYTLDLSSLTRGTSRGTATEQRPRVAVQPASGRRSPATLKPSNSDPEATEQRPPVARSGIDPVLTGRRGKHGQPLRVAPGQPDKPVARQSPSVKKKTPEKTRTRTTDYGDDPPPRLTEHPDLIKAWIERWYPDMLTEDRTVPLGPQATAFDRLSPERKAELEELARADPLFALFLDRAPLAENPRMIVHWINRNLARAVKEMP